MKLCRTCQINPPAKWRTICKDCRNRQKREYRQTEIGQATTKRYNQSEARKQASKDYSQSQKGKASEKRYRRSDKGRVTTKRSNSQPNAIENRKRYNKSKKGKAAFKRSSERRKKSPTHKIRIQAQNAIRTEIQAGRLPKAREFQCRNCDSQAQEYHHYNGYEKEYQLDVIPLCKSCHYFANRNIIDIAI